MNAFITALKNDVVAALQVAKQGLAQLKQEIQRQKKQRQRAQMDASYWFISPLATTSHSRWAFISL